MDSFPKLCTISEQLRFQSVQSSVAVTVGSEDHMGGFVGGLLGATCARRGATERTAIRTTTSDFAIFERTETLRCMRGPLIPFSGAGGSRLYFCLGQQFVVDAEQKTGSLLF